jgi:Lar family restriction alleviation protein
MTTKKPMKPCPFCGSDDLVFECKKTDIDGNNYDVIVVECMFCHAHGPAEHASCRTSRAKRSWNKRVSHDKP